jgi:hypothetical protein
VRGINCFCRRVAGWNNRSVRLDNCFLGGWTWQCHHWPHPALPFCIIAGHPGNLSLPDWHLVKSLTRLHCITQQKGKYNNIKALLKARKEEKKYGE